MGPQRYHDAPDEPERFSHIHKHTQTHIHTHTNTNTPNNSDHFHSLPVSQQNEPLSVQEHGAERCGCCTGFELFIHQVSNALFTNLLPGTLTQLVMLKVSVSYSV